MTTTRLVPDNSTPEERARVLEELLKPAVLPGAGGQGGAGGVVKLANGNYLFKNIAYQGRILPAVELSSVLLENGASKTQAQWAEYFKQNNDGWNAVDAEMLYQCLFCAYNLRNDTKYKGVVQEIADIFQTALDPKAPALNTLTKVSYGSGLDAVVSRLGKFPGQIKDTRLQIPEFTRYNDDWSYFVLANEQAESKLGSTSPLPANAKPVLEAVLGKNYENAGAVFQYFSPRKGKILREVRLWIPTTTNRNSERVVALVGSSDGGFNLDAGGSIDYIRPAFGVREQKNFP